MTSETLKQTAVAIEDVINVNGWNASSGSLEIAISGGCYYYYRSVEPVLKLSRNNSGNALMHIRNPQHYEIFFS